MLRKQSSEGSAMEMYDVEEEDGKDRQYKKVREGDRVRSSCVVGPGTVRRGCLMCRGRRQEQAMQEVRQLD